MRVAAAAYFSILWAVNGDRRWEGVAEIAVGGALAPLLALRIGNDQWLIRHTGADAVHGLDRNLLTAWISVPDIARRRAEVVGSEGHVQVVGLAKAALDHRHP